MRKLFVYAVAGLVFIPGAWCVGAVAVEEVKPGVPVAAKLVVGEHQPFNFKVQYWRSGGTAMFRNIGFDVDVGPWESELEYPMDGDFVIFGAEYGFNAWGSRLSVDLNYGFSSNIDGTMRDWDWVRYDPEPLIYAETDTDAECDFLSANIYYRLWGWGPRNSLDVFAGYHSQENSFTNRNVRVLTPVYFTAAGNVAQYEMDFKGARAGVRMDVALSPRFTVRGNFAFIPYVDFDATGKWLLRDISFSQSADGYGFDFDLCLDFEVARNIDLTAGVKFLYLRATDGEESGYAQGQPYGPSDVVDEVESDQFGGTVGVLVKF